MSDDDIRAEAIAERAAEKAVTRTFLMLGIDVSTPAALLKAQRVITFGYRAHDAHETIVNSFGKTGLMFVVCAFFGVVGIGLKDWLAGFLR